MVVPPDQPLAAFPNCQVPALKVAAPDPLTTPEMTTRPAPVPPNAVLTSSDSSVDRVNRPAPFCWTAGFVPWKASGPPAISGFPPVLCSTRRFNTNPPGAVAVYATEPPN